MTNPYDISLCSPHDDCTRFRRSFMRLSMFALLLLLGVTNVLTAHVDAYKEGYRTADGYAFIAVTTFLPCAVGIAGMLRLNDRGWKIFLIWYAGSLTAMIPGVLIWLWYAVKPMPRIYEGKGQMHIFLFPMIHLGFSLIVYFTTALLVLVNSQRTKHDRTMRCTEDA